MNTSTINSTLSLIAQKHLGVETLETRNSDSLDFYDLSIWTIQAALKAAFLAGKESGADEPNGKEIEGA